MTQTAVDTTPDTQSIYKSCFHINIHCLINVFEHICKCVELFLICMSMLCFYEEQYGEQTAVRAEIGAKTLQGTNAERTKYYKHLLL